MDLWCKWCAHWTENPGVSVQLRVDPQIINNKNFKYDLSNFK